MNGIIFACIQQRALALLALNFRESGADLWLLMVLTLRCLWC
jgi:hypothetical protein